ncbi:hypothetical protein SAMN05216486_101125 [bacterium JGI 053]|nr:hypothetical protein SAMN05216486_101125 [bacterium JGI 053]
MQPIRDYYEALAPTLGLQSCHSGQRLKNHGLTGVILRSERDDAAPAKASAGPKDLLAAAARVRRGSVTVMEAARPSAAMEPARLPQRPSRIVG